MNDYSKSGYDGLSSLDYWRLADELSVIDAAILITGNDPSERVDCYDDDGSALRDSNGAWRTIQKRDYPGYEPAFKALRLAILSDKLRAKVAFRARDSADVCGGYYVSGELIYYRREIDSFGEEVTVPFDTLIRASDFRMSIFSNRTLSTLHNATTLYVLKEPAWDETTVAVEDLKVWLSTRGLAPKFFFPQGRPEGFRDPNHSRYSPKLACAVAAWEAVQHPKPNMSAKATVEEWVQSNAVRFGMVGSDGVPALKAIKEVSTVVNWATGGGAVPTYTGVREADEQSTEKVENFSSVAVSFDIDVPF